MRHQSATFLKNARADHSAALGNVPRTAHIEAPPPLVARFMLPDGREFACNVADLSSRGARFGCDQPVSSGLPIVAYVEGLGRVEGITGEAMEHGFTVHFALTGQRLERFEKNLQWLFLRQQGFVTEERRGTRYLPVGNAARVIFSGGEENNCAVMDISLTGAAIRSTARPELGSCVMLGRTRGRVIRHLPEGFAIEFVSPLEQGELQRNLR